MNIWSSFRLVPPVSPEAMAWATLSFATYLATSEFQPQVAGHSIAPLALALAVQLCLSTTKNLTSARFARSYARAPKTGVVMAGLMFRSFGAVALWSSDATAARLMIVYFLMHAAMLASMAAHPPKKLHDMQGTWTGASRHRRHAVLLEAAGLVVSAATLATTWVFAGPMAFAAMMSVGVLVVRTLANWVVVLYLLDVMDRDDPRGDGR